MPPPPDRPAQARFVTSSGTGIGKTLVATALIHQVRRAGGMIRALKPVISGYDGRDVAASDSGRLLAALGRSPTQQAAARISPWRFAAPLSPHMAAAAEGSAIEFDRLVEFCRTEMAGAAAAGADILIEGIGGVMVPLSEEHTVLDWIQALEIPAVLVVGSYLGALSHALTAAQALRAAGIAIDAVVVSESATGSVGLEPTAETLRKFLPEIPVIALPRLAPAGEPWRHAPPLAQICLGER